MTAPLLVALALSVLVQPASASFMAYASAARAAAVHGYCLGDGGGFTASPSGGSGPRFVIPTSGGRPRRLVPSACGVLYVAERDRVEAFRIGERGALDRLGQTKPLERLNPEDMVVAPDCRTLYVPDRRRDRILAYALDSTTGAFVDDANGQATPASCYLGPRPSRYHSLELRDGLLYLSGVTTNQGISILILGADGALPSPPAECDDKGADRPVITASATFRTRLDGPSSFLIDDERNILYVERRFAQRISAFRLRPDFFDAPSGERRKDQQSAESKTAPTFSYIQLVRHKATLFATQFLRGRIDVFRLGREGQDAGKLPKQPSAGIAEDVSTTPVRMAIHPALDVLYVATGAASRLDAYRLSPETGYPREVRPFSRSEIVKRAFLNDVAVVDLADPGACP